MIGDLQFTALNLNLEVSIILPLSISAVELNLRLSVFTERTL